MALRSREAAAPRGSIKGSDGAGKLTPCTSVIDIERLGCRESKVVDVVCWARVLWKEEQFLPAACSIFLKLIPHWYVLDADKILAVML